MASHPLWSLGFFWNALSTSSPLTRSCSSLKTSAFNKISNSQKSCGNCAKNPCVFFTRIPQILTVYVLCFIFLPLKHFFSDLSEKDLPQECLFTAKYFTVCFFRKIFFFHCHRTVVEIRKLTPMQYSYLLHSPYSSFSSGPRAGVTFNYPVSLGSFNLGTVHKSLCFVTLTFYF